MTDTPPPRDPTTAARRRRVTVVVGCDGHPDGDAALRFAATEAQLRHARLVVVTAYRQPVDPDLDDFDTPQVQLRRRATATATFALRRALNQPTGPLPAVEIVTVDDEPSRAILDHAADAVMVIIGAHDHGLVKRLFTSLTSRRLLAHSHIPVTIVPTSPH